MAPLLKTAERILVRTALGEREIQICLGDITALSQNEKVDFIMVSAFLGDYSPMRGTVIGALKYNLNISVRNLSMDKLHDLRTQFNCWISRKLPSDPPYRQLICFERRNTELTEAVKEVFRAMMPAFNNVNKTVITPLLATGHQQGDTIKMLNTMVWTAARWMWLGMPLQQLKIVIYVTDADNLQTDAQDCLRQFCRAKQQIEKDERIPKEPDIKQDVYLIYCEADSKDILLFTRYLKKKKHTLSVLDRNEISIREANWQHDLFEVMLTVSRIVPVMSSAFLQNPSCIDQFNVALCCNRQTKRHLLTPLLTERVKLPTYMNMVQWINCRSRTEEQFDQAADTLLELIKTTSHSVTTKYDVFISYCHKNTDIAQEILNGLKTLQPKPNVFFDFQELTAGVVWQQTLYTAIENSRCVLALISSDYEKSAVCQEEFNLALARHFSKDKELELVPLYISDRENKNLNQFLSPVRLGKEKTITDICLSIGDWMSKAKPVDIFSPVTESIDMNLDSAVIREHIFVNHYELQDNGDMRIMTPPDRCQPVSEWESSACDVYISHSLHDQTYATFLEEYLLSKCKGLKITSKSNIGVNEGSVIDSARCIVVLLSSSFVKSSKNVEEFNVFLSRERVWKFGHLIYIMKINELLMAPEYFNLVPCDTSLCDEFWWDFDQCHDYVWKKHDRILAGIKRQLGCGLVKGELCPLLKAGCDILMMLDCGRYLNTVEHTDVILQNVIDVHLQAVPLIQDSDPAKVLPDKESLNLTESKLTDNSSHCEGGDNNSETKAEESTDKIKSITRKDSSVNRKKEEEGRLCDKSCEDFFTDKQTDADSCGRKKNSVIDQQSPSSSRHDNHNHNKSRQCFLF